MGSFGGGKETKQEAKPVASAAPAADAVQSYGGNSTMKCDYDHKEFMACLSRSSNANDCDHYYKALQMCQSNN